MNMEYIQLSRQILLYSSPYSVCMYIRVHTNNGDPYVPEGATWTGILTRRNTFYAQTFHRKFAIRLSDTPLRI